MSNYNKHMRKHIGHRIEVMSFAGDNVIIYCGSCAEILVDYCQGKCKSNTALERAVERKFDELSTLVKGLLNE